MTLPVTALAAAICALLLIFMKFQVIGQRIRTETMFGAGEDAKMKMVRGTHANLAENAPIASGEDIDSSDDDGPPPLAAMSSDDMTSSDDDDDD